MLLEALQGPEAPPRGRAGCRSRIASARGRRSSACACRWTTRCGRSGRSPDASPAPAFPDQLVIVGNHRDAWVYGGVDPSSGTASLMELARSLGTLAKQGARPERTIVFANWDAEEFTLTSSTEWGEQHARDLGEHAVAYLNVDSSASGQDFKASAVPSLNRLVVEAARDTLDLKEDDARDCQQPARQRLGLHGLPQLPRRADRRHVVQRTVRRLSLRVRQPSLDAEVRRPRLRPSCRDDPAVGRDGAAPRERRHRAARLPRVRGSHSRVRQGKGRAARPGDRAALRPLDAAADRFAAAAEAAGRRMETLLAAASRGQQGDGRAQSNADADRARVPSRRRHPGPALVPSSDLRAEGRPTPRRCSPA